MINNNKQYTVAGIILTVFITILFSYAVGHLIEPLIVSDPKVTPNQMKENELRAFKNMQLIAKAQKEYIKTDWDKNGEKSYAVFIIHLNQTIDENKNPVIIDLIPKELAFSDTDGLGGYIYNALHNKGYSSNDKLIEFDYKREWAAVAYPTLQDRSANGVLSFFVSNSGNVFAKPNSLRSDEMPRNPVAEGWFLIKTAEELKKLQDQQKYTQLR